MAARFWLYSHNFTHSGAPLVLASIARELAAAGLREQLRIVSWGGLHDHRHSTLQYELKENGIKCLVLNPGQSPPKIRSGDRLLLNTVALPDAVIHQAIDWLRKGKLKRLDWFAHESDPQIWIQSENTRFLISETLKLGRLQMRVPSKIVLKIYQKWLDCFNDNLDVQCPALEPSPSFDNYAIPEKGHFSTLRIALVGAVGYGNKGHLWLLNLLQLALEDASNQKSSIRPLELTFLGVEEDNRYAALTKKVVAYGKELLGNKFNYMQISARDKLLVELQRSNLLVCCSLKEAFSCISSEALYMGLPLLRNHTGGSDEQLIDGITGFDLGETSSLITPMQIDLLQNIRDSNLTPEKKLINMSINARKHGATFLSIKYTKWLLN